MSTAETSATRYGGIAVALHWIIAVCLLVSIILGLIIGDVEESASTERVLAIHKSVGITIFVLMLVRLAWRLTHRTPPLPASMPTYQRALAALTHALLYLTLLVMPLVGYVAVAARGRETQFFGLFDVPQMAPLSRMLSQNATMVHVYGQYVIYALLAAHIGAAFFHHFVLRDDVLARMLPRRSPEKNAPWTTF
ncbi:MAG: cytochrome b [Proteobacteria bacterium]|nr:cytochrome b [Pseudomonadota bacterium]